MGPDFKTETRSNRGLYREETAGRKNAFQYWWSEGEYGEGDRDTESAKDDCGGKGTEAMRV